MASGSAPRIKTNDTFIVRQPLKSSQAHVAGLGIMIPVAWTLPAAQAALSPGVPPQVAGLALVDTGADHTCISALAAQTLGLKCVGQGQGYGAGGLSPRQFFQAQLRFTGQMVRKPAVAQQVSVELQAASIPGLEDALHCKTNGNHNYRMVALLGRDILSRMKFIYDGPHGAFSLEWSPSAF